jgi:hypothetical protein
VKFFLLILLIVYKALTPNYITIEPIASIVVELIVFGSLGSSKQICLFLEGL